MTRTIFAQAVLLASLGATIAELMPWLGIHRRLSPRNPSLDDQRPATCCRRGNSIGRRDPGYHRESQIHFGRSQIGYVEGFRIASRR